MNGDKMKLCISNIAWDSSLDDNAYKAMHDLGFSGLEIAPTKVFGSAPYEDLCASKNWAIKMAGEEHFEVPSMQSIWFGKTEKIFESKESRAILFDYTKKAVDFAESINCKNLVFGCPKNRISSQQSDYAIAVEFFRELGDYAHSKNTCIGMEANPSIYGTNFINTTQEALRIIGDVNSPGFRLNLDVGTMIENKEAIDDLAGHADKISHVHISEPYLKPIQERPLHNELAQFLKSNSYESYVSIEMGKIEDFAQTRKIMEYIREIFA